MRYENAAIPAGMAWSSPFARWQGALAELSGLDIAADVTARALRERHLDPGELDGIVFGWTVPQPETFRGVPALAERLGAPTVTGPMVSQDSVTSVACLAVAAAEVSEGTAAAAGNGGGQDPLHLVVAADRTSNGPTLHYPAPSAPGGAPTVINWVLDGFAADTMVNTAEKIADDEGISRDHLDELSALRFGQYARALADDRDFQRRFMVPVRTRDALIDADEGVSAAGPAELAALRRAEPDSLHTHLTQAYPADGAAGAIVTTTRRARELSQGGGVAQILAAGSARGDAGEAGAGHLHQAARAALRAADLRFGQVDAVTTHVPFAVGDLCFAKRTGFPAERMNSYGCSLVYGHPPAPAGLRSIAELITELQLRGGGLGLFAGCASGDTASALVIRVGD